MNKFDLENQYQLFLQRMDLRETEMPADQRRETKRTFMAALGQMLMICVHDLDAFKNPLTTEAVPYMSDQVKEFFEKEIEYQSKHSEVTKPLPANVDELIDDLLVSVFRQEWMDDEEWKDFLNLFLSQQPEFIETIKSDLITGIKNGYDIDYQLKIVKEHLSTVRTIKSKMN